MRAAIVGCGTIAHIHAESISRLKGITLAAFADVSGERGQVFQNRYGGNAYTWKRNALMCCISALLTICMYR